MLISFIVTLLFAFAAAGSFEPIQVMCEINGQLVPAMIDTGAEITVMSASCAKRCRIHNLIDTQHSGKVVGIGSSEIVGGIEGVGMRIGPLNFQNKISILRHSRCDFLIGLDILERFKCEISLKDKLLKFNVRGDEVRIPLTSSSRSTTNNYEYASSNSNTRSNSERSQYSWIARRETSLAEDQKKFEAAKSNLRKVKFGNVIEEDQYYDDGYNRVNNNNNVSPSTESLVNNSDYDDEEDDSYILDDKNISLEGV